MSLTIWIAFFAAAWAISLSPGAGAVAAMSAGLSHGFSRGYWVTVGLILGIWTQILVVGVGVGALIAASALAFEVVKWAGAAYLLYLGIKQWRAPTTPLVANDHEALGATRWQLVLKGWGVNAVNPKGTVFLLAVVPQFLNLQAELPLQYLVIGATLGFTDAVVMAGYTLLAVQAQRFFRTPAQMKVLNRLFGGLFMGMALLLATFRRA